MRKLKKQAGGLVRLSRHLAKEAPASRAAITKSLVRSTEDGLERSVIAPAEEPLTSSNAVLNTGTTHSVAIPQQGVERVLRRTPRGSPIVNYHSHPKGSGVSPSEADLLFWSERFPDTGRDYDFMIASPPQRSLEAQIQASTAPFMSFRTQRPQLLQPGRVQDARSELMSALRKGQLDKGVRSLLARDEMLEPDTLEDLIPDLSPFWLQRYDASRGRGRAVHSLPDLRFGPGESDQTILDMLGPEAIELLRSKKFAEGGGVKNFKPQTRAPKGALCACGDALGPHFLAADGGSVPESRAPWAPAPRFSSAGEPSWGDVWEVIKSQGPAAIQAWLRKQAEYMAGRAAPYYGGQRQVNGAANLKEQLDMLAGTARGATAATLGAPGDLQSLGRAAMAAPRGPLSALEALQQPTVFPKSEELKKGERGFLARGAGTPGESVGEAFGDFVPIIPPSTVRAGARAAGRGAEAVGRKIERGVERGLEDPGIIGDITRAAGRTFAASPARAVKPKGGNFDPKSLDAWLEELGAGRAPPPPGYLEDVPAARATPVKDWARKQLANYVRKDLGAPTDPLLAVEREFPSLHLPEERMPGSGQIQAAADINRMRGASDEFGTPTQRAMAGIAKRHFSLTDEPMTPWGWHSGANVTEGRVGQHLAAELEEAWPMAAAYPSHAGVSSLDDLIRHTDRLIEQTSGPRNAKLRDYRAKLADAQTTDWRAKKQDEPMFMLTPDSANSLGFDHVLDYLEAATEPYTRLRHDMAQMLDMEQVTPGELREFVGEVLRDGPDAGMFGLDDTMLRRWRGLQNAGLLMEPDSLGRLSVADAVRKTAQWNKFMSEQEAVDGPLSKGWKEFKAYPDKGMRWVEFGKPDAPADMFTLPEGYKLKPFHEQLPPGQTQAWKVVGPDGADAMPSMGWSGHGNRYSEDPIIREGGERAAIYQFNRLRGENALREGLGAEGDAMGHCVGGYCDDVLSRGTKIYSLRDAKGKPHVTIEVRPGRVNEDFLRNTLDPDYKPRGQFDPPTQSLHDRVQSERRGNGDYESYALELVKRLGLEVPPSEIIQIKGKGNAAPVADYLPFVQDFVRSGKWGRVGDLRNTGLFEWRNESIAPRGYYTPEELEAAAIKQGMAPEAARILREGNTHRGYASGGRVELDEAPGFLPRNFDETVDYALRVFGRQ